MSSRSKQTTEQSRDIPNLDEMSRSELVEYRDAMEALISSEPSSTAGHWFRLAHRYVKYKIKAMDARLAGQTDLANKFERECSMTYTMIPPRMRWRRF